MEWRDTVTQEYVIQVEQHYNRLRKLQAIEDLEEAAKVWWID